MIQADANEAEVASLLFDAIGVPQKEMYDAAVRKLNNANHVLDAFIWFLHLFDIFLRVGF